MGWGGTKGPNQDRTRGRDTACWDFRDVLAVSCSPRTQTCFPSLLGQADPSSIAFPTQFAACGVCDSSSQHRDMLGRDLHGHIALLPYPKAPPSCSFPGPLLAPCSCQISLSADMQEGEHWLHQGPKMPPASRDRGSTHPEGM